MQRALTSHSKSRWRCSSGVFGRRLAISCLAIVLVALAKVAATLSATAPHRPEVARRARVRASIAPERYDGEPELARNSAIPPRPRAAAVRFVRDYALWSTGRLASIPAGDATHRVLRLLEHEGRRIGPHAAEAARSVEVSTAGGSYLVTSAVGNFLIGMSRLRWLVISLPGD